MSDEYGTVANVVSFDGVSDLVTLSVVAVFSNMNVAVVMLQLCLLLMVAVTGYRVGQYK